MGLLERACCWLSTFENNTCREFDWFEGSGGRTHRQPRCRRHHGCARVTRRTPRTSPSGATWAKRRKKMTAIPFQLSFWPFSSLSWSDRRFSRSCSPSGCRGLEPINMGLMTAASRSRWRRRRRPDETGWNRMKPAETGWNRMKPPTTTTATTTSTTIYIIFLIKQKNHTLATTAHASILTIPPVHITYNNIAEKTNIRLVTQIWLPPPKSRR